MSHLAPLLAAAALLASPPAAPPPPDGVELAGWDAGAAPAPSAPGAFGGERSGKEATRSDRVADYHIRALLDPVKHTIEGSQQLTWRNRSALPIRAVYLHLYLNAFESADSTFLRELRRPSAAAGDELPREGEWGSIELRSVQQEGRPASWTFVHPDGGPDSDHTVVRVDLPAPVPPGGTTRLDIAFHDQLPRLLARTGWFGRFHLAGQWYPKIGVLELPGERGATRPRWNCHEFHAFSEFYGDFGAYDLEVVVPAGYTVAASGLPQGQPEGGGAGVTWRFRAQDVHDVVFTAWDGFAPPLTARWTGPGSPEVEVRVLFAPEYAAQAQEALQATLDALAWFSRTLGPYPYPAVTCLIPPFNANQAAGMEYETFFTSMASNSFPLNAGGLTRYVTVHEFGHGYFMGLLASNEFEEPFLDEGLNELWNARMLAGEAMDFRLPAPLRLLGFSLPPLGFWEFEGLAGRTARPPDPLAASSWKRWSGSSYASVYPRTALAFQDLERRVGAEPFARAMALYYRRWHFRHPGTGDLRQAFLDAGADRAAVERFFAEQVLGVSQPDDRLVRVTAEEVLPPVGLELRDGARLERKEDQVRREIAERRKAWAREHGEPEDGKPGPFPWRSTVEARRLGDPGLPHVVAVTFEDGSVERLDWPAGERWGRWILERPVQVRSAQLDPERPWLTDLRRLDDGRTRKAQPQAARRWALDAWAWLQLLLGALEAL